MLLQPEPGTIVWTLITFFVLLLVLRRTAWRPLLAALDERERRIREALAEAERARLEAESLRDQHRQRLDEAQAAAQQVLAEARQTAEGLRADVVARAREEAQKVMEEARRTLVRERELAALQLRGEVAELALAAAGKLLAVRLDDQASRRLVDDAIERLPAAAGSAT